MPITQIHCKPRRLGRIDFDFTTLDFMHTTVEPDQYREGIKRLSASLGMLRYFFYYAPDVLEKVDMEQLPSYRQTHYGRGTPAIHFGRDPYAEMYEIYGGEYAKVVNQSTILNCFAPEKVDSVYSAILNGSDSLTPELLANYDFYISIQVRDYSLQKNTGIRYLRDIIGYDRDYKPTEYLCSSTTFSEVIEFKRRQDVSLNPMLFALLCKQRTMFMELLAASKVDLRDINWHGLNFFELLWVVDPAFTHNFKADYAEPVAKALKDVISKNKYLAESADWRASLPVEVNLGQIKPSMRLV